MRRECPNCREPVSFFRSVRTTAWGRFPCKACGSILGISLTRRFLAIGVWAAAFLVMMLVLRIQNYGTAVYSVVMLGSMTIALYLTDTVTLVDRRAFTCKKCGYDLRGLTEQRCPECATVFDPAERERILARIGAPPPPLPGRRIILVMLVFALLAGLVAAGMIAWNRASRPPAPTPPRAANSTQPAGSLLSDAAPPRKKRPPRSEREANHTATAPRRS